MARTWFRGTVVGVETVGQRGKATRDTGTHPYPAPLMHRLREMFDLAVAQEGGGDQATAKVIACLTQEKDVFRYVRPRLWH